MAKRLPVVCVALLLAFFFSFAGNRKGQMDFTRTEKRVLRIPTAGLFDNEYFTITPSDMMRDGWKLPVADGLLFTPDFEHEHVGWHLMSAEKGQEVTAVMNGVVRLARKTDLGRTVVVLHANGLESVYGHLSQSLVKPGDAVRAGQPVAKAGAAHGMVFTYFTFMVNGVVLNPSVLCDTVGTLHFQLAKFRLGENGGVRATLHKQGEVEERQPGFDWPLMPALIDLNRPLTEKERQHVGVATPGLFERSSSFTLDLSQVGRWCYPLPGAKVISPYGGARKNHTGTDLKTSPNDKIRAVFDGVVRFSGVYSAYGNMIVIRHANGLETCYSHNSKNLVRSGDRVKAGDVIATVGRTGRATTEHCHFEVRVNGVPFNSDYIFDHNLHELRSGKLSFVRKAGGGISVKAK